MSKEMMICPIEGYCPQMGGSKCIWQQPHNENGACIIGHNTPACPACVRYIPGQPKKPATCPDQVCKFCGRPSIDWDEECVEGFHEAADIKPSEMPLVKNLITYPPDIAEALEVGKIRQQRADMAWHKEQCKECIGFPCPMEAHDSAVASKAVKEFAELLEKTMPSTLITIISGYDAPQYKEVVIAHIRAMAGKE